MSAGGAAAMGSGGASIGRGADAAAREYLDQPGLCRPLALARERMERLGRLGGTIDLGALSEDEASALGGLLGSLRRHRRPRARQPFKLPLADLDASLRRSRFELPLERALALVGPPPESLPARREREREALEALWREALAHPLCALEPAVGAWVERLRTTGVLARAARSSAAPPPGSARAPGPGAAPGPPASPELAAASGPAAALGPAAAADPAGASGPAGVLPAMRALLRDALDLGARLPAVPPIERGRLACQALGGDPKALDDGRALAGLLLGQLAARAGVRRPRDARERRRVWERFGVLTDPVSADVLTLGLRPLPHGPLASALELMAGRHFRLTLGQLATEPLRFEATGVVSVCENPAVVVAAEAHLGAACPPLVCVGGWPSSAADTLLAGLADQGTELRYHGDFDWEGVRIAALVRRRYGARSWRYDAASYRAALAAHPERVQPLDGQPQPPGPDAGLTAALLECRGDLQEEAVLDDLLEDLEANTLAAGRQPSSWHRLARSLIGPARRIAAF